jgi:very-short-patch-repair endonuclease
MVTPANKIARRLRRDQTDAVKALWLRLCARQLCGAKFRRLVPVGNYIADFLCPDAKLIIEVDGASTRTAQEMPFERKN